MSKLDTTIIGVIVAAMLFFVFEAWLLMLVMGAVHHDVFSSVPAVSFTQALLVALLLAVAGSIATSFKVTS